MIVGVGDALVVPERLDVPTQKDRRLSLLQRRGRVRGVEEKEAVPRAERARLAACAAGSEPRGAATTLPRDSRETVWTGTEIASEIVPDAGVQHKLRDRGRWIGGMIRREWADT